MGHESWQLFIVEVSRSIKNQTASQSNRMTNQQENKPSINLNIRPIGFCIHFNASNPVFEKHRVGPLYFWFHFIANFFAIFFSLAPFYKISEDSQTLANQRALSHCKETQIPKDLRLRSLF